MNKPSELPQWASGPSAQTAAPSLGKRLLGWIKEKPSFQVVNWFWGLVSQWLAWVSVHKHDGVNLDKVDLAAEVYAGDNGKFEIEDDNGALVNIALTHTSPPGLGQFTVDVLRPLGLIRLGRDPDEQIDIESTGGPSLDARLMRIREAVGLPTALQIHAVSLQSASPTGNAELLGYAPLQSSQYRDNLMKAKARVRFTEAGGNIAAAFIGTGYNVDQPAGVKTDGNRWRVDLLQFGIVEDVVPSVANNPLGTAIRDYKVEAIVDTTGFLSFTVSYFDVAGGNWVAIVPGAPTPPGTDFTVTLYAS